MKLLPSQRVLCTPYNHALCHFMQSHIRKVHACLTATSTFGRSGWGLLRATAVTRGWHEYRNKSQHKRLTLEKKISPAAPAGIRTHDLLITSHGPALKPQSQAIRQAPLFHHREPVLPLILCPTLAETDSDHGRLQPCTSQ